MNIELIVQDCFFDASQSGTAPANFLTNPISTSTWEHWFNQWLEALQPAITVLKKQRVKATELTHTSVSKAADSEPETITTQSSFIPLDADTVSAPTYELTLRLSHDAEIQQLNFQFRHKNQPTDVLAFAALEVDSPEIPPDMEPDGSIYLGDIVISVETAYRQAQQRGHPLTVEMAWLATHGLLHLLGWNHPDEESLQRMLNQQQTLLQIVNLKLLI